MKRSGEPFASATTCKVRWALRHHPIRDEKGKMERVRRRRREESKEGRRGRREESTPNQYSHSAGEAEVDATEWVEEGLPQARMQKKQQQPPLRRRRWKEAEADRSQRLEPGRGSHGAECPARPRSAGGRGPVGLGPGAARAVILSIPSARWLDLKAEEDENESLSFFFSPVRQRVDKKRGERERERVVMQFPPSHDTHPITGLDKMSIILPARLSIFSLLLRRVYPPTLSFLVVPGLIMGPANDSCEGVE